jgi:hypothetical protein
MSHIRCESRINKDKSQPPGEHEFVPSSHKLGENNHKFCSYHRKSHYELNRHRMSRESHSDEARQAHAHVMTKSTRDSDSGQEEKRYFIIVAFIHDTSRSRSCCSTLSNLV